MQRLILKNNDNLTLRETTYLLPDTYQAVEYLESSGTQYIDTGILVNLRSDGIEDRWRAEIGTAVRWGAYDSSTRQFTFSNTGNRGALNYFTVSCYTDTRRTATGSNDGESHIYNFKAEGKLYVDGELVYDEIVRTSYDTINNYYLFGDTGSLCSMRIYYHRHYRDGELIRNMIPCYRKSDSVAGMYDSVNGLFYTNDGTGTFAVGSAISNPVAQSAFSEGVMHSLQSVLISNCQLIDPLVVLGDLYQQVDPQGDVDNQLTNFYLQWNGVNEKGISIVSMLVDIANNKAIDGTARIFHGMRLSDGTVDTSLNPVIDGDLKAISGIHMGDLDELGVIASETEDYAGGLKRAFAHHFRDLKLIYDPNYVYIDFADPVVEAICIENWSSDGQGIRTGDISGITSLPTANVFEGNTEITSFDELRYFTGLTSLRARSFQNCSNLRSITIPQNVTSITGGGPPSVFNNCPSLETVTLLNSITITATYTFGGTTNSVTRLNVPSIEILFGCDFGDYSSTYKRCPFDGSQDGHIYINDEEVTEIDLSESSITEINSVIRFCKSITGIVFPPSLTSIGNYAFHGCSGLSGGLTFPSSLTSIGNNAFYGCSGLSGDVVIPSSPTIANQAFAGVTGITNFSIEGNLAGAIVSTTVGNHMGNGSGTLHVGGNFTNASNFAMCFKHYKVDGNWSNTGANGSALRNVGINSVNPLTTIRIGGDYSTRGSNAGNSAIVIALGAVTSTLYSFLEIGGTITSNYCILNNISASTLVDGFIVHLGYDTVTNNALPCAPAIVGANNSRVAHIYVGDGSSAAHDNAILAQYLADADWAQYSSKLDTWYNYNGEYKTE